MTAIPLEDQGLVWTERILAIFSFIHAIIMFIHVLWKNRKTRELAKTNKLSLPLYRITLSVIVGYIFQNLFAILVVSTEYYPNAMSCKTWYIPEFGTYYISKFFIWYYAITRLKIVFSETPFLKYSDKTLKILTITFALTALGLFLFCVINTHVFDLIYLHDDGHCAFPATWWFAGSVGVFDSAMGVICYWLFYRKMSRLTNVLKKMNAMDGQQPDKEHGDYELCYILRKYAILAMCTLLSTWLAAGVAMFVESGLGLFSIDTVTNTWCILLYDVRYDYIYSKLFKCIAKPQWSDHTNANHQASTTAGKVDSIASGSGSGSSDETKNSIETKDNNNKADICATPTSTRMDASTFRPRMTIDNIEIQVVTE